MKTKDNHYIDNKKFSQAVHEYVLYAHECKELGEEAPTPNNYIGECFIKLSERTASKYNFNQYTWKEEMILDGIENCIQAILNYNIEKATRSGNPNAYGYFSLIIYRAFLRRIAKEKKQIKIRTSLIDEGNMSDFCDGDNKQNQNIVEKVRNRINAVRDI